MSSWTGRLGGLLLRGALRGLRAEIDPEGPGGAYLLGLRKLGVVPHGRFTRYGWSQAILLAARGVSGDVVGRTHGALEAAGVLRQRAMSAAGGGIESSSEPTSTVSSQP
jgi:glycerol-3-phosphate acyltransferase PlsX